MYTYNKYLKREKVRQFCVNLFYLHDQKEELPTEVHEEKLHSFKQKRFT